MYTNQDGTWPVCSTFRFLNKANSRSLSSAIGSAVFFFVCTISIAGLNVSLRDKTSSYRSRNPLSPNRFVLQASHTTSTPCTPIVFYFLDSNQGKSPNSLKRESLCN